MHRAQPLAEEEAPEVFEIVKMLSIKAGVPIPALYAAVRFGECVCGGACPKHAVIAATYGLVGLLNKEELSGVLGHEVAHILNRDILPASIGATLAGALTMSAAMFRWYFFLGRGTG
jgi:heat shock protein HtpX